MGNKKDLNDKIFRLMTRKGAPYFLVGVAALFSFGVAYGFNQINEELFRTARIQSSLSHVDKKEVDTFFGRYELILDCIDRKDFLGRGCGNLARYPLRVSEKIYNKTPINQYIEIKYKEISNMGFGSRLTKIVDVNPLEK